MLVLFEMVVSMSHVQTLYNEAIYSTKKETPLHCYADNNEICSYYIIQ
jgi:hypothetical protein